MRIGFGHQLVLEAQGKLHLFEQLLAPIRHDHQALEAVIQKPAAFVGLIGSKRKARMILKDLANEGVSEKNIQNVHTPIGLDINAITVPEIAVSIVAQLIQYRRESRDKLVEGPVTND